MQIDYQALKISNQQFWKQVAQQKQQAEDTAKAHQQHIERISNNASHEQHKLKFQNAVGRAREFVLQTQQDELADLTFHPEKNTVMFKHPAQLRRINEYLQQRRADDAAEGIPKLSRAPL